MERSEDLKRPHIEDVVYEITSTKVMIASPCTTFIDIRRRDTIQLSEVETLFSQLKGIAANSDKLKLKGVTKFLPTVRALYPKYCQAVEKMNSLFDSISAQARKIQAEGIHFGCRDDELLEEMTVYTRPYDELFYRNSVYSIFMDYYFTLKKALEERSWEEEGISQFELRIA